MFKCYAIEVYTVGVLHLPTFMYIVQCTYMQCKCIVVYIYVQFGTQRESLTKCYKLFEDLIYEMKVVIFFIADGFKI